MGTNDPSQEVQSFQKSLKSHVFLYNHGSHEKTFQK